VSHGPDDRGQELKDLFFETAQELLQALNEEALKLEKKPGDLETVRSIRRTVHTLKGDSAAVGFSELSELAHTLEDALAVEAGIAPGALAEVAFAAADTFSGMLASYRTGNKLPSAEPLRKMVRKLARDPKAGKTRGRKKQVNVTPGVDWTEYEKLAAQKAVNQGKQVYHINAQIDPDCAMPIAARQLVLKALSETGEVLATRPEAGSTENVRQFHLLLASTQSSEQLTGKCRIPTIISKVAIENVGSPADKEVLQAQTDEAAPETDASPADAESDASIAGQTTIASDPNLSSQEREPAARPVTAPAENVLRVDAERIDAVLNLVGELIIGKSMMQEAFNEFAVLYPKEALRGRFADAMALQSRVLNDLQRAVMKVRMVPVEQLFRRFPRMVRDVGKQCGKEVDLLLNGQDTALDKSLLDAIAEPITHLVRNAIGHGIESADERARSGKPARGTVRLDAYHQGNQVIVEISDDGRGIDAEKVKSRAITRGLLKPSEAAQLSEADILDFIFRPGFSTADEITEIAGRGVGLDIVQNVLHRLKGTVQALSHAGKGSTFRLQLPLTLAIIKALLFRVEQRLYAVPLNAVAEIARVHECDIHQVDNCEVLQLRNRVLPLVRLGRHPEETPDAPTEKVFVLVIAMGDRKLGLLVNALEGEEELVLKALDERTAETDLVSGASILGNGHVVLILNLSAIVDRFARSRPDSVGRPGAGLLLRQSEQMEIARSTAGGQL
jgi:two-component system, chemotaxis family, sensor kinase CheA